MRLVKGGFIAIRLNERNNHYFQPGKGLRQGDLLSPLLFNLVADIFTRMMGKAANKGYLKQLMSRLYLEVMQVTPSYSWKMTFSGLVI
jgi:hypothetical protein